MSMFPSHPRDHTYWPGAQYLCICSNLATQNCWPQQAADHLLLSPVCHHSQHFITPDPWDTFTTLHALMPVSYCYKLIYCLCWYKYFEDYIYIYHLLKCFYKCLCSPHLLQWHRTLRHISKLTHQHILIFNLSTGLPFLIFALCNVQG